MSQTNPAQSNRLCPACGAMMYRARLLKGYRETDVDPERLTCALHGPLGQFRHIATDEAKGSRSMSQSNVVSNVAFNTRDYACPKCGAAAGTDTCRDPRGRKRMFHVERVKAAYRATDTYHPIYNRAGSRIPERYAR